MSKVRSSKNPVLKWDFLKGSHGFSLFELVTSSGLSAVIFLLISGAVAMMVYAQFNLQKTVTRVELNWMLRKAIINQKALEKTITNNPVPNALYRKNYGGMEPLNTGQIYEINIYDANSNIVAGRTDSPAFFDYDGLPCQTPGVGKCMLKVLGTFSFQGVSRYGTLNHTVPEDSYPSWHPSIPVAFMRFAYKVTSLEPADSSELTRRPIEGSIYINPQDLGF